MDRARENAELRRHLLETTAVRVPDAVGIQTQSPLYLDPLQDRLLEKYRMEVPFIPWPAWPQRLLRISAQLYNSMPQYEQLARALKVELF